jgi:ABC-type branched-subunit amino acid transport system permease subunit
VIGHGLLASAIGSIDFWQFVAITAGVYAIFALGLQLQFGFTGLLNFGHIGFMAIGAYTMGLLMVKTHLSFTIPLGFAHLTIPAMLSAALISMVVAMLFGVVVGLPTLRLRTDYLAITTIAFGEIIRILILNWQSITGGPQGLLGGWGDFTTLANNIGGKLESLTGATFSYDRVLLIFVWLTVLLGMLLLHRVVRSPWGRVLRAIREDEDAANALGKNPLRYKLQAMVIGSAFAAVAGFFFSYQYNFISPESFEPLITFFAWVIILLGGSGRLRGVPVGAGLFALIFAGTRFFDFWPLSLLTSADRAAVRLIIIGLILIGLMAFRPQGLFGKREELLLER